MAQKATKSLARRNAATLARTHLTTLGVHALYLLLRLLVFPVLLRSALPSRRSWMLYLLLSAPGLAVEAWLEKVARPTYAPGGSGGEVQRAGEDLDAKGLTEWLWDVLYWTWGCVGFVALVGDWGWFLWAAIPIYSAYLAYTTFGSMRQGLAGMGGGGGGSGGGAADGEATSARQRKMEKRGGQKMQYR